MDYLKARALFRKRPECYATTGLDWDNAAHYPRMARNLQYAVTSLLANMQVCRDPARKEELREQLLRVEARVSVLERVSWHRGMPLPANAKENICRLALEKMADAFEEGAAALENAEATNGRNVLAGAMLEVAVGQAAGAKREGGLGRFVRGPMSALAALADFVVASHDLLEMEDLPRLAELVANARKVPAREALDAEHGDCDDFREALVKLEYTLRAREARGR